LTHRAHYYVSVHARRTFKQVKYFASSASFYRVNICKLSDTSAARRCLPVVQFLIYKDDFIGV